MKVDKYVGGWGNTSNNTTTFSANLIEKTVSGQYRMEDIRLYDRAGNRRMYYCLEDAEDGNYYLTENGNKVDGIGTGICSFDLENPNEDNTKPQLTSFELTGSVDSEGRKSITHSLTIDGETSWENQETGLKRMYLRIIGPGIGIVRDGDAGFTGTEILPLDAPDGEYNVSYFFVTDAALNDKYYNSSDMDDGFTTSVTFQSSTNNSGPSSTTQTAAPTQSQPQHQHLNQHKHQHRHNSSPYRHQILRHKQLT